MRVAVIGGSADLARLVAQYPRAVGDGQGIDFELVAVDYDALQLTREGYFSTRSLPGLDGWDCESTLWFRWVFIEWDQVAPAFADAERYDKLWKDLSGWSTEDFQCHRMPADEASRHVYNTMLQENRHDVGF